MKKIALAVVLAPLLAGCASMQPDYGQALQFNYVTSPSTTSGLVRVFSLNGNTVLQFTDLTTLKPKVYGPDSATPMAYSVIGQYAIVAGQHPQLTIEANGFKLNALHVESGVSASSALRDRPQVVLQIAPAPSKAAHETLRVWALTGGMTLRDNLETLARQAGFSEPIWHARNPHMVAETTEYSGTFTDLLGYISEAAPQLDFLVDKGKLTIEVSDVRS